MKLQIYSIRDLKGSMYNVPFFQPTHGTAERSFNELIRDPQSLVHKYPADYELFHVGTFDDETGRIETLPTPSPIISGLQLMRDVNPSEYQARDEQRGRA